MSILKLLTLILLFFIFIFPRMAYSHSYTLEAAIEYALKVNPSVEEKLQAFESAKMNVGVAQSYFWPKISFVANRNKLRNNGSYGSMDEISNISNSQGIRTSLSLFDGFSHLNNLQRSVLEKEIAEQEFRLSELELIANIQIQFFNLLQARRDLEYVENSIHRITTQLQSSQLFSDLGMAPYINVLQNRVELSQAKEQLITTQNAIRIHEIILNSYLDFSADEKIVYIGDLEDYPRKVDYSEKDALQVALRQRPDLRIAQKSIEVAEKSSFSSAGEALPRVDLTYDVMSFNRDYTDRRFQDYKRHYWSVGLNFTWTFFEGGKTAFGVARDRKHVNSLRASYQKVLAAARTETLKALMDIRASQKVFETARDGLKAAEESYAMARNRYNTNVGTITELIDAQTRLTEAEVRISKALADYQVARAKLFFYLGEKNIRLK